MPDTGTAFSLRMSTFWNISHTGGTGPFGIAQIRFEATECACIGPVGANALAERHICVATAAEFFKIGLELALGDGCGAAVGTD
jgi:hypothetical protein